MSEQWPTVKLGEVLRLDVDRHSIDAAATYPMVGVLSFGRGLFDREPIENGNTSYRFFYRLKAEHIVMSQLFGWEGALALSSEKFAGKFLSPQFPTFLCDEKKLNREFLGWLMRRRAFWEDLGSRTSGMGDRRRTLNPEALFKCDILLPSLAEQQRIVSRIEELVAKIREARTLRHQAADEAEALSASWLNSVFENFPNECVRRLGDVTEIVGGGSLPDVTLAGDIAEVLFVKVSDMNRVGNESFLRESASGVPANAPLLRGFRVVPVNAIVFPKRGGAIATNKKRILQRPAVLDPNTMGVFSKDEKQLTPEFLFKWFGNLDLASMQQGTSVPQINKGDLAPLHIHVPALREQYQIVAELNALQAEVEELKRLQTETATELDALLPAVLDRAFNGNI